MIKLNNRMNLNSGYYNIEYKCINFLKDLDLFLVSFILQVFIFNNEYKQHHPEIAVPIHITAKT